MMIMNITVQAVLALGKYVRSVAFPVFQSFGRTSVSFLERQYGVDETN